MTCNSIVGLCGRLGQAGMAIDTPFEDDLKILETDLIGTIALTKAMLPHLLERKGKLWSSVV